MWEKQSEGMVYADDLAVDNADNVVLAGREREIYCLDR